MIPSEHLTQAQKLVGKVLDNDWTVIERIDKKPNQTGGFFSIGYIVQHKTGKKAFLKALDFSVAFGKPDFTRALEELTATYNFERDLLEKCRNKNVDRVVRALEHGDTKVDGFRVPYLIFELADGDIRTQIDFNDGINLGWTLRMLHNVSVGLNQLHNLGIAHQDLKPSNILVFERKVSKIADLGRAAHPDYNPPHNEAIFAGAYSYAPPELLYGFIHSDYKERRFGCDAFLLGNIILFAFTGFSMTSVLLNFLAEEHKPYPGMKYVEALPYLQLAFNEALLEVKPHIPAVIADDIILILRELCEPDLMSRGRSFNRNRFSLQKYISKLDLLAYKAERNLF